ncbi:hypothetical protein KJ762_02680 [bacterium]|nr:hypothetical protein [bacterium]MBU1633396.1 hypothetical protein [bacterium]
MIEKQNIEKNAQLLTRGHKTLPVRWLTEIFVLLLIQLRFDKYGALKSATFHTANR